MAKKDLLSEEQIEELKALGIKGLESIEEARKVLIKKLADNDVDGVEEDPIGELVDMYTAFYEPEEDEEEEEEEEDEEDEVEDAEEVEEKEEKPKKKKPVVVEDEEEDEDDEEEEEDEEDEEEDDEEEEIDKFDDMDRKELKEYIKENELPISIKAKMSDDDIRLAIRNSFEHAEEVEYTEAASKLDKKSSEKSKDKKVAEVKPPKKTEKKADQSTTAKRGVAWDNEDEEHLSLLNKGIHAIMAKHGYKKAEYEIKILKQGCTINMLMESGKKAIWSFDKLRVINGEIHGSFFYQCLKGEEEVMEIFGDDEIVDSLELKEYNPNLIYSPKVSMEIADEILSTNDMLIKMFEKLSKSDTRSVKNRKKMEEKMKEEDEKAKATVKKKVVLVKKKK